MSFNPSSSISIASFADRLKSEALRLHPAQGARDKPPPNPQPTSAQLWLKDLKRTVENENHRRREHEDPDCRLDQSTSNNNNNKNTDEEEARKPGDDRNGRRTMETPAKRTFYNRGTSFEENDKENENR